VLLFELYDKVFDHDTARLTTLSAAVVVLQVVLHHNTANHHDTADLTPSSAAMTLQVELGRQQQQRQLAHPGQTSG
jgi:hypothetical protein